jgi:hypothetical protein
MNPRYIMTPHRSDVRKQNGESLPKRKGTVLLAPPFVDICHDFECTA